MNIRTQITVDPELQRRAEAKAAEQGISFAEYVRRLLARDLGPPLRAAEVSLVFDLVDEGPATNIAADKDRMIGDAVWHEHTRSTGRKRPTRARLKIKRA
jgi:hypothetical protein